MRATLTSYVTTSTAVVGARDNLPRQPYGGFNKERVARSYRNVTTPVLDVVETNDIVRFSDIGPFAIPGYAGSGLCRSCDTDGNGTQSQRVKVEQCRNGACVHFTEDRIQAAAGRTTVTAFPKASDGAVAVTSVGNRLLSADLFNPGGIVIGGQSFRPGDRTTIDSTPISVATNAVIYRHQDGGSSTIHFSPALVSAKPSVRAGAVTTGASSTSSGFTTSVSSSVGALISSTTTTASTISLSTTSTTTPAVGNVTPTTSTTTTTVAATPAFVVSVQPVPAKYHKRQSGGYIGFAGNDAVVVATQADAAVFSIVNDQLITSGQFVGATSGVGNSILEKFTTAPTLSTVWSAAIGGGVSFRNSAFTYGGGSAIFCSLSNGTSSIFGEYTTATPNCRQIILTAGVISAPVFANTTSTTAVSTLNTTVSTTTSAITADPSSDPDPTNSTITARNFNQPRRAFKDAKLVRRGGVLHSPNRA
ncbi:hypothetical protein B0A49_00653 [Cryomyces minteri]|uniref:DUF7908 domain-containing protein n=1 Tax=Cryomyces minteri TaxID=331657 RepID=A0A4U0XYJ3_9PEZI|nr:hypothetical protein B0A49_00653 [Cryomyces minteri]